MKKNFVGVAVLALVVLGVASCGSEYSEEGNESTPAVKVQEVDGQNDGKFYIIEKEVEEGRTVTCVVLEHDGGYDGQGGLSCNWDEYNHFKERSNSN